jgi:hypothetical protein
MRKLQVISTLFLIFILTSCKPAAVKKATVETDENWLPIERKDLELSVILRVYGPDLERMKTWQAPKAEKI